MPSFGALGALALVPWAVQAAARAFAVPEQEWGSSPTREISGSANGQTGTLRVTRDEATGRLSFATYYYEHAPALGASIAGITALVALHFAQGRRSAAASRS